MLRSHPLSCAALAVASLFTLTACEPDLGPCDQAAAEKLVYKRGTDGAGCKFPDLPDAGVGSGCDNKPDTDLPPFEPVTFYVPYYEGQAIAHASCGNGGVCHSAAATGALRHGAPSGLNFDLGMRANILSLTGSLVSESGHSELKEWIDESWELIDSGEMPPGEVGRALQAASKWFSQPDPDTDPERFDIVDATVPALSTAEGKEVVRNWLACGAPVATGVALGQRGPDPIQPTWDDIHSVIISDTCVGCHAGRAEPSSNGGLILTNPCASWKALVQRPAISGGLCAGFQGALVSPGLPESSLLYRKIDDVAPECGFPMPFGGEQLSPTAREAMRLWIVQGALPPTGCVP